MKLPRRRDERLALAFLFWIVVAPIAWVIFA